MLVSPVKTRSPCSGVFEKRRTDPNITTSLVPVELFLRRNFEDDSPDCRDAIFLR